MNASSKKRKADVDQRADSNNKRPKGKKQWSVSRKNASEARAIQPGDVGIWATCAMKKEGKSVGELRDLFQEYASELYGKDLPASDNGESDAEEGDIEGDIQKEIDGIKRPAADPLFESVKLDTQCLLFFRTRPPVEPVNLVQSICRDAANGVEQKRCRYVKRLTPISMVDKATERGLEETAKSVLAPHFHGPENAGKKFAIRVSTRNNREFTRDYVIKTVAAAVGPGHKVDLSAYDHLILVEIYKNILGMSVVGPDFDTLKRFNLAELHDAAGDVDSKPTTTD